MLCHQNSLHHDKEISQSVSGIENTFYQSLFVFVCLIFVPFLSVVLFPSFLSPWRFSKASVGGSLVPTWKTILKNVPVPTTMKPRY